MQSYVVAACAGYIRNAMASRVPCVHYPGFRCDRCLGTARPIDGRTVKEVKVDDETLEAVLEFFYLGDMLGRAVVASWMM